MFCTKCGAQLEQGARFCQDCGAPVSAGQGGDTAFGAQATQAYRAVPQPRDAQTTQVMPPVRGNGGAQPSQAQRYGSFQPAGTVSAKRRSAAPGIAIGIACAVAMVAIAFFVVGAGLRGSQQGESSSAAADQESSQASLAASDVPQSGSVEASDAPSASSGSASASSASAEPVFDQVQAEDDARKQAAAAGMQVFSGTVRMTTYGQRAAEVDSRLASSFRTMADTPIALLEFSMPENLTAASAGDQGRLQTRPAQESLALSDPYQWADFDGQLVSVAAYADDLMFPSDVAGALYSAIGSAELIAPLTEARAAALAFERTGAPEMVHVEDMRQQEASSSSSAAAPSSAASAAAATKGGYVLADSATRAYTKSELSGYSDYDLFIARNEIYARHGRKFMSADLQKHFDSQSWYKGTIEASAFDESVLSDTELANASLILEIEQSRNSKYL